MRAMGAQDRLTCTLCGREGVIYMLEGKPYCPSCMAKERPPLPHFGPERRRRQKPTVYLRRATDFKRKRPSKG